MKLAAVIFDLNGTILDDEDLYAEAFRDVLKSLGADVGENASHVKGIGVKENWPILIEKYGIKTSKTPEVLALETQKAYLKRLNGDLVRPGFDDFVQGLKDSGILVALATSNTWEVANEILEKQNLQDMFEIITTADEVAFNKPDPDLFTISAEKLGIERSLCLVIEDSPAGVTAAHRAGMKVVGIADTDEDEETLNKADLVVQGFSDITPKAIDNI